MNEFIEYLNAHVSLEQKTVDALMDAVDYRSYQEKDILLNKGQVCKCIRFIVSGTARSYFINSEGQEFTWFFHFNDTDSKFENYYPLDYYSLLRKEPSSHIIQATGNMETIELPFNKLYSISREYADFNAAVQVMTEKAYCCVHKRAFSLLTENAKQRYIQLLRDEPYLLDKFKHYLVASYIGIAPQSFSRLKKEMV